MATRTVHTLAYKLLMDNEGFTKGAISSRRELNETKRLMMEVITPQERINVGFARLSELLKKGVIDQDVFNRKARLLREEYDELTGKAEKRREAERKLFEQMREGARITERFKTAEEKHVDTLFRLNRLVKAGAIDQNTYNRALRASRQTLPGVIAAKERLLRAQKIEEQRQERLNRLYRRGRLIMIGTATATAGLAARSFVRSFKDQVDQVDKLNKVTEKLGISTEMLTRLQFTAGQVSGLSADQVSKGLEKMVRRVSEAAAGTGEAKEALKEIGLDAIELEAMSPDQAFISIARAMDKVADEGQRVRLATKLFDDEQAGLHTTLKLSNKELERMFKLSDSIGNTLSDFEADRMSEAKDAIDAMTKAWEGMSRELATGVAPAVTKVINNTTLFLGIAKQMAMVAGGAKNTQVATLTPQAKKLLVEDAKRKRMEANAAKREQERQADLKKKFGGKMGSGGGDLVNLIMSGSVKAAQHAADSVLTGASLLTKRGGMAAATVMQGPSGSIASGSSAEFNILNRTSVQKNVEIDLARKAVKLHEMSLRELKALVNKEEGRPLDEGIE